MTAAKNPSRPAFEDRYHAGRLLAELVHHLRDQEPVVLALPRGGVPLGYEVAKSLNAPLDLLLVRKLFAPGHPTLSLGDVGEGGAMKLDEAAVREHHVPMGELDQIVLHEREELERQAWKYYRGRPRLAVRDRVVLLVDDGVATGETIRFALEQVRKERPAKVYVAVGVVAPEAYPELFRSTDGVFTPVVPSTFHSIAEWYGKFPLVEEGEIERLLQEVHHLHDQDALPARPA